MEDDGIGYSGLQRHHTPLNWGAASARGFSFRNRSKPSNSINLLKAAGSICSRPREPWPAKPPQREP